MSKKSFLLHSDYKKHIDLLSINEKGELLECIFNYTNDIEVNPKGMVAMAFSFIKSQLDRDNDKYEKLIEKQKVNGAKGGRPKKKPVVKSETQINPNNPKVKSETQKSLNDSDNDNVTESETDSVTESETKKEYWYQGKIIKLTKSDYYAWVEAFPHLANKGTKNDELDWYLDDRDNWYSKNTQYASNWFISTSRDMQKQEDTEREVQNG